MADIIRLGKERKARKRAQDKRQADENAVKFGRTKGEHRRDQSQALKDARALDAHKREP